MNIVLVHGAVDWPLARSHFNGIADHLRRQFRARVLEPRAPLFSGIRDRSLAIARQISDSSILDRSQPIHVIAHSLGGFDARLLASYDIGGLSGRLASVTCIGTPHWGSAIASFALKWFPAAALPDTVSLLLRAEAERFNRTCPDRDGIRYIEVVGIGRPGVFGTSWLLAPLAGAMTVAGEHPHDGFVSLRSASRGRATYLVWPEDHVGLVGHDLDFPLRPPSFPHLNRFTDLVKALGSEI